MFEAIEGTLNPVEFNSESVPRIHLRKLVAVTDRNFDSVNQL